MQTCPACQFVSPLGDQFCRQCGVPFTAASRAGKGRWLFLFFFVLLIGGVLGALVATLQPHHRTSRIEIVRSSSLAAQPHLQQAIQDRLREAQERAHVTVTRRVEAVEHVRELAQRAATSDAASALGKVEPLELTPYEYPNAKVGNYSRIPGNEMLQMRTKDSFDTINLFYQKQLGKPLVFIHDGDDDEKSLVFQSNTAPAVFVSVEHDEDSGRWLITVMRAPFQFPQADAAKTASGAAKQ